ncbi:MAG: hypothetical protein KDD69_15145 [Bdellovibrionales bacterium]|nr:hypothetical protein [Bdellovibrionales bacterium]
MRGPGSERAPALSVRRYAAFGFNADNDSGVVLLLLSIFLVAIVSFLALLIDGARMATASTEKRMTAEAAVTAALEAYRNHDPVATTAEGIYLERLGVAIDRAEEVIALRTNALMTSRHNDQIDASANELKDGTGALSGRGSDVAGVITAGRWFESEPDEGCSGYADTTSSCPCPGAAWQGPCFLPNTASATDLTAFDLTLRSKDDDGLPLLLKPVMDKMLGLAGSATAEISERARATLHARVGLYGIDLSRSIAFDSHADWNHLACNQAWTNLGSATNYVYRLDNSDPSSRCNGSTVNPCTADVALADRCTEAAAMAQNGGCKFSNHHQFLYYYNLPAGPPADPSAPRAPHEHYRSDFACFEIGGSDYLIDVVTQPQPLSDILTGLNTAITEIETRTVPGDRIGIFGFNGAVIEQSVIGPTNQFLDAAAWSDLREITDVTLLDGSPNNTALRKRLETYRLFPEPDGLTDIPAALLYAGKTMPEDLPHADLQVTFFSDFINTCKHSSGSWIQDAAGEVVLGTQTCQVPDYTQDSTVHPEYSSLNYFQNGMEEAVLMVVDADLTGQIPYFDWTTVQTRIDSGWKTFSQRGIRFNAFIFGELVEPSVLLRQSKTDPTKCMDQADARQHHRSMVPGFVGDHDWRPNDSQRCIWFGQRDLRCKAISVALYPDVMTAYTGGYFLPIRPPCDPTAIDAKLAEGGLPTWGVSVASCQEGALEDNMDSKVCAPWTGDGASSSIADPAIGTYGTNASNGAVSALVGAGAAKVDWGSAFFHADTYDFGYWNQDSWRPGEMSGRMVCDTKCRSKKDQILDVIKNIYNVSPYSYVRSDV